MGLTSEPYGLDESFEKVVLWCCCTNPGFWSLVGHAIDPNALEVRDARLIIETCRQIAKELGRGPGTGLIVLQRLTRKVHEGKATVEQIEAISELLDEVEDSDPPDFELVVNELLPILRRRMQSQAIVMAHGEFAKRGDFGPVQDMLAAASSLGEKEQVSGVAVGPSGFDRIEESKTVDRLPTGVLELDLKLNGGAPRRSLGVWLADSGGGKSMALVNQAGECMRQKQFSGFVTLELPEHIQLARLFANLTGVAVNDILDIPHWREEAKRRIHALHSEIGLCEVAEFAPHATTVKDLVEWIEDREQHHGVKMETLIVDYADKVAARGVRDDNQYLMMRQVYEGLRRDVSMDRGMWVWTGSQSSRPDKKRRMIDLRDVADSMHKVRVADVVISLNPLDDDQIEMFVAKNRLGASKFIVGPLLTDFEKARLVPVTRELGEW